MDFYKVIIWKSPPSFKGHQKIILDIVFMKILLSNRITQDGMPRSVTSHLWLYLQPTCMYLKLNLRLIQYFIQFLRLVTLSKCRIFQVLNALVICPTISLRLSYDAFCFILHFSVVSAM